LESEEASEGCSLLDHRSE